MLIPRFSTIQCRTTKDPGATGKCYLINAEALENACTGSSSLAPHAIREDQSDNQASKCCSSGTLLPRREINKFNQSRAELTSADTPPLPEECGRGHGGRRECPELVSDSAAPVDLGLGAGGRYRQNANRSRPTLPRDPISKSDLRSVGLL